MGNYVFTRRRADRRGHRATPQDEASKHDMGGNIVPTLVERGEAQVYDFSRNEVPGRDASATAATGATSGRSTPTTTRTWTSSRSSPSFNLYNREWPILTWPDPLPPAKFVFDDDDGRRGQALDSMVCAGVVISGGDRAALGPLARARTCTPTREVEDSVLMQGVDVGRNAVVRRAIVDKNVRIADGRRRSASTPRPTASASRSRRAAIVVIPKGATVEA